jgi:hypothetical protein
MFILELSFARLEATKNVLVPTTIFRVCTRERLIDEESERPRSQSVFQWNT